MLYFLTSKYYKNFLQIPFSVYGLFRGVILEFLSIITFRFPYIIFQDHIVYNICYFKLVKRESWSFFLNVSCGLKKNVYSVGWIVIQMSIRISWSVVFCRSSIAELIFYLSGNSVTVRGVLKSPIMIVDYFLLLYLLFLSHVF